MLKRISGGELLARMTVWWLLLLTNLVGIVLYDLAVLSPQGLTRLVKVAAYIAIPAFLVHQLVLNRKKRESSRFGNNGGELYGGSLMRKVILTVLAWFQFLVSTLFAIVSGLAVFVAVRTHSTGRFHGMPFTARHDLPGAVDALILALVFFCSGYTCLRFRRPRPIRTN